MTKLPKLIIKQLEIIIIGLITLVAILINALSFIRGYLATPTGMVYLGTVHWSGDFFTYLAQMSQGRNHILFSHILHTAENLQYNLIGWQMVLLGRIYSILGINIIYGYQIAVTFFNLLMLISVYFLIKEIFSQEKWKRIIAYLFFITSTAFFTITLTLKGIVWGYQDYWYNVGNSIVRIGHTPHHAIGNIASVLAFLLTIRWYKKRYNVLLMVIILSLAALVLTSITPVYWVLTAGGLILTVFANFIIHNHSIKTIRKNLNRLLTDLLPTFIFFVAGIPMVLYIKSVFVGPPYSDGAAWEALQQIPASLRLIILGSGLVIIFALIGGLTLIKKHDFSKILGVCYIFFCSLFFFSPIPYKMHLTNARFWPPTLYIFIGIYAVEGIYLMGSFIPRYKKTIISFLLLIYILSVIPTEIVSVNTDSAPRKDNAFYYIPKEIYTAYIEAEKISKESDLFLVQWPMNLSFPGITGRHGFHAYDPTTINFYTKNTEAFTFFAGKFSDSQMWDMLEKYHIDYIFGYVWNPKLSTYPKLKRVFHNSQIAIDKVIR